MENQEQLVQQVLDKLWSASCDLKTLGIVGQGPQAVRFSEIADQLQVLQNDLGYVGFSITRGLVDTGAQVDQSD